MRVLIVEDEPPIRHLLDDFLGGEGFDTLLAENGRIGVELAGREHPDLILMDIMLPILDGAAATRMLKGDPETCGIRIIAMSANLSLLRSIGDLPADHVIAKPFDLDVLLGIVNAQTQMNPAVLQGSSGLLV